jgi:TIR domain-containing protein
MKIFLCYASEDHVIAEQIQLALTATHCTVFFDEQSLPPGSDFHARIRIAIKEADIFVFLITLSSIAKGKFTLTELQFARDKWPSPVGKVIPVNIGDVPIASLPNYLKAATVLPIYGNAPSEVRAAIEKMQEGVPAHPDRLELPREDRLHSDPVKHALTRSIPSHSTGSLLRGLWFVFQLDGHKFAFWSSITGKEEVYLDGKLVSSRRRRVALSLGHTYTMEVGDSEYAIAVKVRNPMKGEMECTLARNGEWLLGLVTNVKYPKGFRIWLLLSCCGHVILLYWIFGLEPSIWLLALSGVIQAVLLLTGSLVPRISVTEFQPLSSSEV